MTTGLHTPPLGDRPAPGPPARLIAFHLPQFHPTPENDAWWGKGFTEWTNVARARPLFPGHHQPHLPADLGFYDLRLPEARAAQADLARAHGIEGFCYWHYWFGGRRLLERPVAEILASGEPDFPFCLGWANESWSRRWMGGDAGREVLIEQTYSAEDDLAHARWLADAFADPRYIKVGGRPLFLVYRPRNLLEPRRFLDAVREACSRNGLPAPYFVGSSHTRQPEDMRELGFDTTELHEPFLHRIFMPDHDGRSHRRLLRNLSIGVASRTLKAIRYRDFIRMAEVEALAFPHSWIPCCTVRWDNTARRGPNAFVMVGSDPAHFSAHLRWGIDRVQSRAPQERIVFVNAWNEWAEGMYLEPDRSTGHAYLEALASCLPRAVDNRDNGR